MTWICTYSRLVYSQKQAKYEWSLVIFSSFRVFNIYGYTPLLCCVHRYAVVVVLFLSCRVLCCSCCVCVRERPVSLLTDDLFTVVVLSCDCMCNLFLFLHPYRHIWSHTGILLPSQARCCCGVVLVVSCAVLFLLCVCVTCFSSYRRHFHSGVLVV